MSLVYAWESPISKDLALDVSFIINIKHIYTTPLFHSEVVNRRPDSSSGWWAKHSDKKLVITGTNLFCKCLQTLNVPRNGQKVHGVVLS